jgi:hypothetical protein
LRPKQTDLISDKGQFRSRFHHSRSYCCPITIFRDPGTDTDIISAQHFWTGGLETAAPGYYDAVGSLGRRVSECLVMSRIRHAVIRLGAGQQERPKYPKKLLSDNNS